MIRAIAIAVPLACGVLGTALGACAIAQASIEAVAGECIPGWTRHSCPPLASQHEDESDWAARPSTRHAAKNPRREQ